MTTSETMIARWTKILETSNEGVDRLRRYLCSLVLGREFGEDTEAYYARMEYTQFVNWARQYTRPK